MKTLQLRKNYQERTMRTAKFKLNHIVTVSFFTILLSVVAGLFIQYSHAKNMIEENYKNKYYGSTLQAGENFRLLFDKAQFEFRRTLHANKEKLQEFYDAYAKTKNDFDIAKTTAMLNEDVVFGEYRITLIEKNAHTEDAEYKKALEELFGKKTSVDISEPMVESTSMNIRRYLMRLSDDGNKVLQLEFMLDFSKILREAYRNLPQEMQTLRFYLINEYSVKKIDFRDEGSEIPTVQKSWKDTQEVLRSINEQFQDPHITKVLQKDTLRENINFSAELSSIFKKNGNLLSFVDKQRRQIVFYTMANRLCSQISQTQLIIHTAFSTEALAKDTQKSFTTFLLTAFVVVSILLALYLLIVFNISKKMAKIIQTLNNNEMIKEENIIVHEIEELKKTYNDLHYDLNNQIHVGKSLSYVDELTKAKNTRAYNEKVKEFLAFYKRHDIVFSMALLDIDDFKKINDTFGHRTGDRVLMDITKLIESHIRANDFLFRVGGEEFVLIFAKTSLENAKIAAEKIRNLVATKLATIEDKKITISIGLSQSRTNDTEESLYERVDMLLYESKKSGKNKVTSG